MGHPTTAAEVKRRRLNAFQRGGSVVKADDLRKKPSKIDTPVLLELTEERLWLAFQALDGKTIAEANIKDLTTLINTFIEKRNLLRGEPTSIVTSGNRGAVEQISMLLLAEMQRRGLTPSAANEVSLTETTTEDASTCEPSMMVPTKPKKPSFNDRLLEAQARSAPSTDELP